MTYARTPGGGKDTSSQAVIAETELAAAAASITFSSIPADYRHLRIVGALRTNTGSTTSVLMRLNGDTAGNYDHSYVNSTGTPSGTAAEGQTSITVGVTGSVANKRSPLTIDIHDYLDAGLHKVVSSLGGYLSSATSDEWWRSSAGLWRGTAAVTSVTLLPAANSFDAGSVLTLYGLKGA